jgi:hypothetical protein
VGFVGLVTKGVDVGGDAWVGGRYGSDDDGGSGDVDADAGLVAWYAESCAVLVLHGYAVDQADGGVCSGADSSDWAGDFEVVGVGVRVEDRVEMRLRVASSVLYKAKERMAPGSV